MRRDRQETSVPGGRRRDRAALGLELLLALLILVLAALVAGELIGRGVRAHRRGRMVADLRAFTEVFARFPPADEALPEPLQQALAAAGWRNGSPFGGVYEWRRTASAPQGAIAVTAFAPAAPLALTRADLLAIDAEIDDGNLGTGRFQSGFNGWPVYLLP